MPTKTHKPETFSERLREALANAKPPVTTAAELARAFALRYDAPAPTPGAVRKWWDGKAVPDEDKLEVLAEWLKVPTQWLRYGDKHKGSESDGVATTTEEIILLQRWRSLPASRRKIILALISDLGKE